MDELKLEPELLNDMENNVDSDTDPEMPPLEAIEKEMNSMPNNKKNIVIDDAGDSSDNDGDVKDGWLDILSNGDLKKKVIKKGDGSRPQRGSKVSIRLVTRIYDGNDTAEEGVGSIIPAETFDNFMLVIGDNDLHQGLDLIVPLMENHEIARAIIKPRFAYGQIGNKFLGIPEDTTLDCLIELLDVHSDDMFSDMADPEEPNAIAQNESLEERLRFGSYKKLRGNLWFERGEYSLAIQCYRGSLKYLDACEEELKLVDEHKGAILNNKLSELSNGKLIAQIDELIEKRAQAYNNLAAAQMKLQSFDIALKSVENSLLLRPDNVKAMYRHAKITTEKGDIEKAIQILKKASQIDPKSESVAQELDRLNRILARQIKEQRQLYRRMMQVKDTDDQKTQNTNAIEQSKTCSEPIKSHRNWSMLCWPVITALGAVATTLAYSYFK